ncbi:MAG: lipopolysaccharide biosynthesis protein RfbH [Lachnospiraceae bacterium]|nr:lipopolysaccharide biosynthesis protein RfbH [Lachnospiraceae bacterium]
MVADYYKEFLSEGQAGTGSENSGLAGGQAGAGSKDSGLAGGQAGAGSEDSGLAGGQAGTGSQDNEFALKGFKPGDRISYASRVFDQEELMYLVDSSLDFWLTSGRFSAQFEKSFAKWLGVKYAYLVNSGSSANLLSFMALTAPELGERQVKRGDEVITVSCGFPTTVSPILQYGAVPVFVDVTIPEYNIDASLLESALSDKTKALMIAHTLGNPFDIKAVKEFCDSHALWLIEDNCDALGSEYTLDGKTQYTGTFGDIGTSSFYPAHHMTMGEGGCVYTNDPHLAKIMLSFRDWGRDCACPPGHDNMCGHRFSGDYGELPHGYDHKYVYSHLGYNLKATDMQAAIGLAQLKKLPRFIQRRKQNFHRLREKLAAAGASEKLILPEAAPNSSPSWFGFLISLRKDSNISRDSVTAYLEEKNIQTRLLFSGNLIRHPAFDSVRGSSAYRVVGNLENTDFVMNNSFWVGVYPGMSDEMIDYMADSIMEALEK